MCPESSIKQIFDLGLESIEDLIKSKMQKIVDDNGISMWVCIECQYTSKYTTAMYKHIERMHLNIALKCDYCSREFKSRNDLNVHVKTSHFCTWENTLLNNIGYLNLFNVPFHLQCVSHYLFRC